MADDNTSLSSENEGYTRKNYDETYATAVNILKRISVQLTQKLSPFASRCWLMFFIFEYVNISVALCLEIAAMILTAKRGSTLEDALEIVRMMPCVGYTILGLMKAYKIVYYRKCYVNLIDELGDMWPTGQVSDEQHALLENGLKEIHFVVKGCDKCNIFFIVGFLWTAFFEYGKARLGLDGQLMVHFIFWLPFDPLRDYIVEFMLLLQTWYALIVIWVNLCKDLLFCIFISHITIQFDLLAVKIKRAHYVPVDNQLIDSYPLSVYSKEYATNNENVELMNGSEWKLQNEHRLVNLFRDVINRHRDLIRLSAEVEKLFSFILLVNFMNSSILICFCGFCCVAVEKWNEVGYKIFLLTVLFQTYLLCWYGQKLIDASRGVADAIYNSGWYMASKRLRAPIKIMLIRCQKNVFVTTYGFSIISLSSYTQIIKTAWSYFTLLLNTYKS